MIDGIWTSGEWSEQWMISELVLLLKAPGTHNECTYAKKCKAKLSNKQARIQKCGLGGRVPKFWHFLLRNGAF